MPTIKTRINLSVPTDMKLALIKLARHEGVPVATKTLELIRRALELEEDFAISAIAENRLQKSRRHISHAQAWR